MQALAIWLELVSFFMVTIDLWGAERMERFSRALVRLLRSVAFRGDPRSRVSFAVRRLIPRWYVYILMVGGVVAAVLGKIVGGQQDETYKHFVWPTPLELFSDWKNIALVAVVPISMLIVFRLAPWLVLFLMIKVLHLMHAILMASRLEGVLLLLGAALFMGSKAISLLTL
jgi:hypothetical protein